jgi:two-component system cell cycle response regulator DivK
VLQADNCARGLDLAHQGHPNLIIMDVQRPDVSGLDVAHLLKADAETRDIPIIATSAFDNDKEIRASGCDGYMAKPIAISQFLELVESLMCGVSACRTLRHANSHGRGEQL